MKKSKRCIKYEVLLSNFSIIMATTLIAISVSALIVYFNIDTEVIKKYCGSMAFVWLGAISFFFSKFLRRKYEYCDDGLCRDALLGLSTLSEVFTLCLIGVELYSNSDKDYQELSIMPITLMVALGMLIIAKYHKKPLNYGEKISLLDESVNNINASIDNIMKNAESQKKSNKNIEMEIKNCISLEINSEFHAYSIIGELKKMRECHGEIKNDKKN